ncbi:MAG: hypothetical protein V7745_02425 [Pseudomonadales bacterium]
MSRRYLLIFREVSMVGMLKKALFGLVLCALATVVVAEDGGFGDSGSGQIDYVNLKQRNIVIDDWQYNLALTLRVHGKKGLETDFALRQGKQVKFEVNPVTVEQDVSTIVDVWLLQE